MANTGGRTVKVTLVRSPIGTLRAHRACVRGLGLRRLNQTVELPDTLAVRGMVARVAYLVRCEEDSPRSLPRGES
jgi:large subunit ribosomal protein L30